MKPSSAWEACRSIKLPAISHPADAMAIEKSLSQTPGIIKLEVDADTRQLLVLYNATMTNFRTIIDTLENAGYPPSDSWWCRIKANWYEYLDDNAHSNARAPTPPCCNKPPK